MNNQKSSIFFQASSPDDRKAMVSGILWFMSSGFLTTCINSIMRILSEDYGYHPFQLVFFYSALATLFYLPNMLRRPDLLRTERKKLFLLRGVLEVAGFTLVFMALTRLPFAMFTTLTFTTPIFGAIMAVYFLGEHMTRRKIIALCMGFTGILIVSSPTTDSFNWAIFLPLLASVCFASCAVCIRRLAQTDPPIRIAFITLLLMAVFSFPLALSQWQAIAWQHVPYIAAMSAMVACVQLCVGQALKRIELTVAQPFIFLNLITSSILGWIFFDEIVQQRTIIGAAFILIGIMYSVRQRPLNTNFRTWRIFSYIKPGK